MRHYKWIAREIEHLDSEVDYERIIKLSYTYYATDFVMNLYYTIIFPYDIMPRRVAEAVHRKGTGKVMTRGQQRATDTFSHFWPWFENGPSSPITQKSVAVVNGAHMGVAKGPHGSFEHNEDFVYTLCNMACELHRLRLRLGMDGFTENQQRATVHFFRDMQSLFVSERGEVSGFPDSWQGILDYCEQHEALDWEHTEAGRLATEALIAQFAERWFPRPLRGVVRPIVITLLGDAPRRVHRLTPPPAWQQRLIKAGMRTYLTVQEKLLPDPQVCTPERNRRKAARTPRPATVVARTSAETMDRERVASAA